VRRRLLPGLVPLLIAAEIVEMAMTTDKVVQTTPEIDVTIELR
jgi:hypothetical protein